MKEMMRRAYELGAKRVEFDGAFAGESFGRLALGGGAVAVEPLGELGLELRALLLEACVDECGGAALHRFVHVAVAASGRQKERRGSASDQQMTNRHWGHCH